MANLAIKGHETRGKEVIEILEILGGKNQNNVYSGKDTFHYYFIDNETGYIRTKLYTDDCWTKLTYNIFTLEEFLEKFPYKVGDKVTAINGDIGTVVGMQWSNNKNDVVYNVLLEKDEIIYSWNVRHLQPYKEQEPNKAVFDANAQSCDIMNHLIKEETMEEQIRVDIPKGYEFAGVDDDNQQVVFEKIGYQYPRTYEECCSLIGVAYPYMKIEDNRTHASCYKGCQIAALIQLLICRDAYWKIAGDWKPSNEERVHVIFRHKGKILKDELNCGNCVVLEFPTEEMRDTFYENFKPVIEQCKELL